MAVGGAMSAQTVLLDFSLEPSSVEGAEAQDEVLERVLPLLSARLPGLASHAHVRTAGGTFQLLLTPGGVSAALRLFPQGLLTLAIDYYRADGGDPLIDYESSKQLEKSIRAILECDRAKLFPTIKRGYKYDVYLTSSARALEAQLRKELTASKGQAYPPIKRALFGRYFPSSDERLLEYDIDSVVYEKMSPFQKIQIVHSKSLGNMLILDELQNIAEADLIYTETLMQRGKENFEGKEIIILGGGDGALLYELLKEKPKFVWMLEIDEDVMLACNEHMKSICGDVLENRKGDNYEIIVGDCMIKLNEFLSQGKKFDYVFGDLTDIPITDTPSGEIWNFVNLVLETSFKLLNADGKFMTHANGASCPESLKLYEEQLGRLKPAVEYTKCSAFVPSFLEDWFFYQVFFKKENNGTA